jgi:SAM-dependent methyltransferase
LKLAYEHYYTHVEPRSYASIDAARRFAAAFTYQFESVQAAFGSASGHALTRIPLLGRLFETCYIDSGGIPPVRDGAILDVGCGDGARLDFLRAIGWRAAVGVETDGAAIRVARAARREVRAGSATQLPAGASEFDGVILHHVIEHIDDPRGALAEAFRALKPGGRLAIVTPNVAGEGQRRWGRYWRGYEAPRHLVLFTLPALQQLLLAQKFETAVLRTSARSAAWMDAISRAGAHGDCCTADRTSLRDKTKRWLRAESAYRVQSRRMALGQQIADEIFALAIRP